MSTHVAHHDDYLRIGAEMDRLKNTLILTDCMNTIARVYWIAMRTTYMAFIGIRWRRRIEWMLLKKCPSCETARVMQCMNEMYGIVLKGRDTFTLAAETFEKLPGCRALGWINRRLVEPWNELAETLAVSTDPEINELASKIANAI